jgi:hypothetical protein
MPIMRPDINLKRKGDTVSCSQIDKVWLSCKIELGIIAALNSDRIDAAA